MRKDQKNRCIREALSIRKLQFDKQEQQAELLSRNETFLKQLKGIRDRLGTQFICCRTRILRLGCFRRTCSLCRNLRACPLVKLGYPPIKVMHVEEDDIPDDRYFAESHDLDVVIGREDTRIALAQDAEWRKGVMRGYTCRWDDFCVNWSISRNWDGSLSKLAKQMYSPVLVNPSSFDIHEPHYVILALNSWVVKDDITREQVWDEVEVAQRRIGEKIGGLKLFPRNLAWYDLRNTCNCSYPEIAEIWDKHYPHDIDVIVVERMKEEDLITKNDLGNRAGFGDNEFLAKQINDGFMVNARCEDARKPYPAKTRIKDIFRDYRNYCLTGYTNKSRPITAKSPISETIRAAVNRIGKFIATFDRQHPRYTTVINMPAK